MKTASLLLSAALAMLAALSACAPKVPIEAPPEISWPTPPERTRVKFVDMLVGSHDVKQPGKVQSKWRSRFFGEEPEVRFKKPYFAATRGQVLYVTDFGGIHVYDFKNETYRFIGFGVLDTPTGIAVSSNGTLYVADTAKLRLYIIAPDLENFRWVGDEETYVSMGGVALDEAAGRVYVVDARNHDIKMYDLEGRFIESFGGRGSGDVLFNFPFDAKVDKQGRLYIMDAGNFRVQIIDRNQKLVGKFGSVGIAPGQFARPRGLALDSDGHIYVVDAAFGNFQIFDGKGGIYLAVGTSGSEPGKFLLPSGIAIDENDRIFVVDQMNSRVQIFQYVKYDDERPPATGK